MLSSSITVEVAALSITTLGADVVEIAKLFILMPVLGVYVFCVSGGTSKPGIGDYLFS